MEFDRGVCHAQDNMSSFDGHAPGPLKMQGAHRLAKNVALHLLLQLQGARSNFVYKNQSEIIPALNL